MHYVDRQTPFIQLQPKHHNSFGEDEEEEEEVRMHLGR